jgi:hypothetical protein
MALGRPVVATDVGGNREIVKHGETGIIVPLDAQAIAEAALNLMRDHRTALRMAMNAKERVTSQFSTGNMVRQYELLYEKTMGNAKSR